MNPPFTNPHLVLLLFTIFKHMCLNNLSDDFNLHLNTVQLMVSEFLMFHENTELLPSCDYHDLSLGDIDPVQCIITILVVIPVINQHG